MFSKPEWSGKQLRAHARARRRPRSAVTISGGRKRSVVGPVALMIRRCSSNARLASSGAPPATSAATISPRPRAESTPGSSRSPSSSRSPCSRTPREERLVVDHVQHRQRGRRDDRPARERRPVIARARTRPAAARRSPARRSAGRRPGPWPASSRPARRRPARTPTASRSAPCRSGPRRTRAPHPPRRRPRGSRPATPGSIRFTPDSPWTGSISTAAVLSPTTRGSRAPGRR